MKLAFRNLFRNKRRTAIASIAISVGLASLIMFDATLIGMNNNMIQSATESFMGEGQIHAVGFQDAYEVEKTINGLQDLTQRLQHDERVAHYSMRTLNIAMLTSPTNVSSVTMVGIDPDKEQYLSQTDEAIVKGDYFQSNTGREILIGTKLAELLQVDLGDRVVLTTAQAYSGDLIQEMFRISGIYYFNIDEMDKAMVFIRLKKAQQMLGIGSDVHEIAITFNDQSIGMNRSSQFWSDIKTKGNVAEGWLELMPEMRSALEMSGYAKLIVGLILFSLVSLGIINTLFMSLHERMFEFGVMRAVGTRPFSIGKLITLEASALAALSSVMGIALGFAVTYWFTVKGIDYSGIEYAGVTMREALYPVMKFSQFVLNPLYVFAFTILVSLYPAVVAARLKPAQAMRRGI
jgi:ABC-type lipoprotein release transport system permease subunit